MKPRCCSCSCQKLETLHTPRPRNREQEGAVFHCFDVVWQTAFEGKKTSGGEFQGLVSQVKLQITSKALNRNTSIGFVALHACSRLHCNKHDAEIGILHKGLRVA